MTNYYIIKDIMLQSNMSFQQFQNRLMSNILMKIFFIQQTFAKDPIYA
jgi:hypothetical protein